MTEGENLKKAYDDIEKDRDKYTKAVLECDSKKIVVVAGPGTGKTFLFQRLLEKRGKKSLVLSFVNALVDDLALGLSGMSEVRTLHGYVASHLWNERKARMCPAQPTVISEDAKLLLGKEINFEEVFRHLSGNDDEIRFYKTRKEYYGKYYGYSDATFAVVKDLETKKKEGKLPTYEQILVDEFQDFNEIEVALIDLLSEVSPVLIAGDDDQSLYAKFKGANPKHLQERHGETRPDFTPFTLPYCSRCPEVVVEAVNDITNAARDAKLLVNNIKKSYVYFKCKAKDKISAANPQILYFQRPHTGLASLLIKQLSEIAQLERGEFSVLIIVPPKLKGMLYQIAKPLESSGFRKLKYPAKKINDGSPSLLDGLKLLLEDKDSNLGWRIVAKCLLNEEDFLELLKKTSENKAPQISELLDVKVRSKIKQMRATLNYIHEKKDVEKVRLDEFLNAIKYEPLKITTKVLKENLAFEASSKQTSLRNIRDIPITLTTIPGSKGLAADYVFLMYFNEEPLGGSSPSEEDVFNFIVAITRAKKGLHIVSTDKAIPKFVQWIKPTRIKQDLMPEFEHE